MLQIVGAIGPSLPISIRNARARANEHVGKADPIWDTGFTTKWPAKPVPEDAPLKVPYGAAKIIHEFESRVAELAWLEETQHRELATTLAEMKANGLDGFSLSAAMDEDMDAANIAESHLKIVPMKPDPQYMAAMKRRIELERWSWPCGPTHKVRFTISVDRTTKAEFIGIVYDGPDSKDAEKRASHRKAFKDAWIARFGAMPTLDELKQAAARIGWYGPKVVLANMTPDEFAAHHKSKRFGGDEDKDPLRTAFAGPEPRPNWDEYDGENDDPKIAMAERAQYKADLDEWQAATTAYNHAQNRPDGYSGPSGILGTDDESDDE